MGVCGREAEICEAIIVFFKYVGSAQSIVKYIQKTYSLQMIQVFSRELFVLDLKSSHNEEPVPRDRLNRVRPIELKVN